MSLFQRFHKKPPFIERVCFYASPFLIRVLAALAVLIIFVSLSPEIPWYGFVLAASALLLANMKWLPLFYLFELVIIASLFFLSPFNQYMKIGWPIVVACFFLSRLIARNVTKKILSGIYVLDNNNLYIK